MSSHFRLLGPLILIMAGLAPVLLQVGALSEDAFSRLVALWPLLIIMLGVEITLERWLPNRFGRGLAGLLMLALALGGLAWAIIGSGLGWVSPARGTASASSGRLTTARLLLQSSGIQVNLKAGDSDDLYRLDYGLTGGPPEVRVDGETVHVDTSQPKPLVWTGLSDSLQAELDPTIPWEVTMDLGASRAYLDLRSLDLRQLNLDAGASDLTVRLGSPIGSVPVDIEGGAMTATLEVPNETAARISVHGALATLESPDSTALTWTTADYETTADHYDITLNSAACHVRIRRVP